MRRALRNVGLMGPLAAAMSAVDIALWEPTDRLGSTRVRRVTLRTRRGPAADHEAAGYRLRGDLHAMPPIVLCGVDETASPSVPLFVAADLARRLDARLLVVHVLPLGAFVPVTPALGAAPSGLGLGAPAQGTARDAQDQETAEQLHRDRLAQEVELLGIRDADVWVLRHASVVDGLRRLATDRAAEFIVVGSHGHGAVRAALLGSTAHDLARDSPCPVVLVPPTPAPAG